MKTLPKHVIEETGKFADPFGYGAELQIRRSGHPLSGSNDVEQYETGRRLVLNRLRKDAVSRAQVAGGGKLNIVEISLALEADEEYRTAFLKIEKEQASLAPIHREKKATSYIAGWGGSAFEKAELPKKGAFSKEDVEKCVFAPHGEHISVNGQCDATLVPRFRHVDSKAFFYFEDDAYRDVERIFIKVDKECGAAKSAAIKSATKAESDEDGENALQEKLAKVDEEYTSLMYERLKENNVEEVEFFGLTARCAMAEWIIAEAEKLEETYQKKRGRLSRS